MMKKINGFAQKLSVVYIQRYIETFQVTDSTSVEPDETYTNIRATPRGGKDFLLPGFAISPLKL